jgi:hypothetical protein
MGTKRGQLQCWLREQIYAHYQQSAPTLIGGWRRYGIGWLLHELSLRGNADLAAAFRARQNAEKMARYWAGKREKLESLERRIARLERELGSFALYQLNPLRDEADKLRRSIVKHEAQ